jgi:hypothetical protein
MSENVFSIAQAAIAAAKPATNGTAVDVVFRAMHGFYGQLWLSKFATGQVGADGADAGVLNAKLIWSHGIRQFSVGTVKAALRQCIERHPEFPPSLPQFVSLCRANAPRAVFKPELPMSGALVAEHNKSAREKLREMRAALRAKQQEAETPQPGLPALFAAIADAVRCAGGNESAELIRLDRLVERVAPKVVA